MCVRVRKGVEREGERGRERQTDRDIDRKTETDRQRHTDRDRLRERDRDKEKKRGGGGRERLLSDSYSSLYSIQYKNDRCLMFCMEAIISLVSGTSISID